MEADEDGEDPSVVPWEVVGLRVLASGSLLHLPGPPAVDSFRRKVVWKGLGSFSSASRWLVNGHTRLRRDKFVRPIDSIVEPRGLHVDK